MMKKFLYWFLGLVIILFSVRLHAQDFNRPVLTDEYTDVLTLIKNVQNAIAKMEYASATNLPDGTLRYNRTSKQLEQWDLATTSWVAQELDNLKDGAVSSAAKLGSNVVLSSKILDGTIAAADLATDSVTTAKIVDANVTEAKIASNAVTTSKIADSNVTEAKINNGAVTVNKIGTGAVTTAKIADSNITTAKIADANITTSKIADANVTTAKIADANITTAKIENNSVNADKIRIPSDVYMRSRNAANTGDNFLIKTNSQDNLQFGSFIAELIQASGYGIRLGTASVTTGSAQGGGLINQGGVYLANANISTGQAVTLPVASSGGITIVINTSVSSLDLFVYPASGQAILGYGANVGIPVDDGISSPSANYGIFVPYSNTGWIYLKP